MAEKVILVLDLEKGDFDTPFKELISKAGEAGKESGKAAKKGFKADFDITDIASGFAGFAKKAVLAAGALGAVFTAKSIQLAIAQGESVDKLNSSLKIAGDFSRAASQDIQNYAEQMQRSTKFSSEEILNQVSLAKTYGATNQQAKDITKTAIGLSKALGLNLDTATKTLSQTLNGYTTNLSKAIPELADFTSRQLKAGEGLKFLSDKFSNSTPIVNFSFAMTQASNSIGGFMTEFGKIRVNSPAIIATITQVSVLINSLTDEFKEFASGFNITKSIILPLLGVANTIAQYILPAFELMYNTGRIIVDGLKALFFGLVLAVGTGLEKVAEVIAKVTGDTSYVDALRENNASLERSFEESSAAASKSVSSIFEGSLSEGIQERIMEIENFYVDVEAKAQIAKTKLEMSNDEITAKAAEKFVTYGTVLDAFSEQFSMTTQKSVDDFAEATKSIESFAKKSGDALKNGLGTAAGNAFSKLGAALVNGENALASFGKAFLASIGQVLVQQGTAFILEGTAYAFSANPQLQALSGGLIASGAAMATFGGIIGAVAGGGGASVGSGGTNANANVQTATFANDTETAAPEEVDRREKSTNVQLVVNGDIFDSEDTGLRLAGLLSNAFGTQGIVLDNGATA